MVRARGGLAGSGKSTLAVARRHAGHLDELRADQELWGQPGRPPGLGPVVEVDTAGPVELARVTAAIADALTAP